MGMELRRGGSGINVNATNWRWSLLFATAFGWEPAGTVDSDAPDEVVRGEINPNSAEADRWPSGYFVNEWYFVSNADARELGAALHRAVSSLMGDTKMTEDQEALFSAMQAEDRRPDAVGAYARLVWADSLKSIADYVAFGGFKIG